MKTEKRKSLLASLLYLASFAVWTALICLADKQAIGPENSVVGLASINRFVHDLTGVHMRLYVSTDWLGLVPVALMLIFALLGLLQMIKRKSFLNVDSEILFLGAFYILVLAGYLLFETFVVNYRPVLINGILEASYPSSTTMLVMCIIPTSIKQFKRLIEHKWLFRTITVTLTLFMVFMVTARLISGVHWFSDIIGGILLSEGLVKLYTFTE